MAATPALASPTVCSTADLDKLALQHQVPVEDALLLAINLYGISSRQNRHRARLAVRLARHPSVAWHVIVPLNAVTSPFRVHPSGDLALGDSIVGHVERIDADEAVGGYFRDDGRAATLNPNARSRCTGCAFCPNTLEAAADPRLAEERALDDLLTALVEQHPHRDLARLREVTVSTGCFGRESAAVDHVLAVRAALQRHKITARLGFLTSVVRSDAAFAQIAAEAAPFVLRLTAECFSRRDLLLKASKANLCSHDMPNLLARARTAGLDTSYTYIVGLDRMEELTAGIGALNPHITEFPNFQVYQAHNSIMAGLRASGAADLGHYLRARRIIERIVGPTGLRPVAWECYRPLWYFTFGRECLVDAVAVAA
ncbi:hypothetical protein AB0M36_18435 [Actinoplanes sp. NPDC051346]|uniref:hypothetical protein n=1 Tax=Actinoplanes sp. NPDC051346 TaxID=3155048 RepID=UPI0034320DF4